MSTTYTLAPCPACFIADPCPVCNLQKAARIIKTTADKLDTVFKPKQNTPPTPPAFGISPMVTDREWSFTVVGTREFCQRLASFAESLRQEKA